MIELINFITPTPSGFATPSPFHSYGRRGKEDEVLQILRQFFPCTQIYQNAIHGLPKRRPQLKFTKAHTQIFGIDLLIVCLIDQIDEPKGSSIFGRPLDQIQPLGYSELTDKTNPTYTFFFIFFSSL